MSTRFDRRGNSGLIGISEKDQFPAKARLPKRAGIQTPWSGLICHQCVHHYRYFSHTSLLTPNFPLSVSPFGVVLEERAFSSSAYRYTFQNQEHDDELKGEGNSINFTYRMHDPRLGRFFAVDPLDYKYPHYSPFMFSGNRLISSREFEGLEEIIATINGDPSGNGNETIDFRLGDPFAEKSIKWSDPTIQTDPMEINVVRKFMNDELKVNDTKNENGELLAREIEIGQLKRTYTNSKAPQNPGGFTPGDGKQEWVTSRPCAPCFQEASGFFYYTPDGQLSEEQVEGMFINLEFAYTLVGTDDNPKMQIIDYSEISIYVSEQVFYPLVYKKLVEFNNPDIKVDKIVPATEYPPGFGESKFQVSILFRLALFATDIK